MTRRRIAASIFLVFAVSFGLGLSDAGAQVREVRRAAEQGDAEAQNRLGRMYATGQGVTKDSKEAAKWFRKSAAQGFARSEFNLGILYERGDGVPRSFEQAREWFLKAANRGFERAQFRLGRLYSEGLGVPKNSVIAYKWYNIAAGRGYEQARQARDKLGRQMSRDEIAEAQRRSAVWKPNNE